MRQKVRRQKMYYFSDRLRKQLAQIPYYPVTIVEAPSGFGKTTAIREYLKENLPAGAHEYWYTCLGEPAFMAWNGICELLSNVNDKVAANLKKLEIPTMDTLMFIPSILKGLQCPTETYIVIDNYRSFDCDIPRELASVFSMPGDPNLHFIFITQYLGARSQLTFHNVRIHTIETPDFFFDPESTAKLFRMEGIRLPKDELEKVFANTEGWVAAIRLQIINFKENGSFDHTVGIEQLVEAAIWNRLTPEEKDFLLSVSVMDSFDARQAAFMLGEETLPENIEALLKSNDFIRYFPDKGIYTMHSILREYLHNRFYHCKSVDFQERILHLAAQSYAAVSQYNTAARFFLKVEDFDAILSMPVSAEYIGNQKEECMPEFIRELVNQCPKETLLKYPFVMLMFCSQMYAGGYFETYWKLYRLIGLAIETNDNLSPDELCKIKSEFAFMTIMKDYNDVSKMRADGRSTRDRLDKSFTQIKCEIPFTFGCPSILFLFWREAGRLDGALKDVEESLPIYRKLAPEHGIGAESVMKAEAMLMRGEDNEAEILCHKALYQARSHRQTCICLSAELVLARIAILRGDTEGYFTAARNIRGYAKKDSNLYVLRMAELCLTAISLFIGSTETVASWVYDMESINKALYFPAVPYAQVFYAVLLFNEKRYNEFLGLSQAVLDTDTKTGGNIRCMMPRIYYYKYLAIMNLRNGSLPEAKDCFRKALEISLPDKIYLPLAQNCNSLDILIELTKGSVSDKEGVDALTALCKRQKKGTAAIRKAMLKNQSPLTPREREIALLVKEKLSAQEISDRLYISKATAKTIIRNIYSKLEIHSRSELDYLEF